MIVSDLPRFATNRWRPRDTMMIDLILTWIDNPMQLTEPKEMVNTTRAFYFATKPMRAAGISHFNDHFDTEIYFRI